jgi:transcriptional/translational regulatory protein YebC/TACO1
MGRAAAVRAATKGKTDAKKAKVNAYYGKKIIMAVKQGGSPDPSANRQLGELIKAAKNNSVPIDVSCEEKITIVFLSCHILPNQ